MLFPWHASLINSGAGHFLLGVNCPNPWWQDFLMNQSNIAVYLWTSITGRRWTVFFCLGVICPQVTVYTCCPLVCFTWSEFIVAHNRDWFVSKKWQWPIMDLWAPPVCAKIYPKSQTVARKIWRRSGISSSVVLGGCSVPSNAIYVTCSGNWPVANLFAMANFGGSSRVAITNLIATKQHADTLNSAEFSYCDLDNSSTLPGLLYSNGALTQHEVCDDIFWMSPYPVGMSAASVNARSYEKLVQCLWLLHHTLHRHVLGAQEVCISSMLSEVFSIYILPYHQWPSPR